MEAQPQCYENPEAFNPAWEFGGMFPSETHVGAEACRMNKRVQGKSHILPPSRNT